MALLTTFLEGQMASTALRASAHVKGLVTGDRSRML